uniref:Beta-theraphotoxin-Cm2a n=1 Tax=Ceratogyrus marshalli TaxID=316287 RepID=TX3_CERMR|nr:RecName: Full=Beta-theraphotoxin-Cm2a; Short=Beta-TRTX-Cm2a; AltName: Full=Ceratotoxin-3; Short=CcoTx3 [Ceratogyrus marshalli]
GVDKEGCRKLLGGCTIDDDCCPHLGCNKKYWHCGWDGTF